MYICVYLCMYVCMCVYIDMCRMRFYEFISSNQNLTTTANDHVFYSTYYPRSSVHFLAPCSNCCKPLKLIHACVCPQKIFLHGSNYLHFGHKWRLLFPFSIEGKIDIQSGSDPEIRVGDQHIGRPLIPVSSEFYVLGEPEFSRVSS